MNKYSQFWFKDLGAFCRLEQDLSSGAQKQDRHRVASCLALDYNFTLDEEIAD